AYEAYIRRNARWNFAVNVMDLTFYHLAISFVFGSTVLSLYASYLTEKALLIGLIPAIQSVGFFWPQLLLARRSEQWPRKRPYIQIISVMERLPYLAVGLSILLWPRAPWWVSFGLLALGLALATGAGGLCGPAWQAMLAKVIPAERRGLLFGLSNAFGGFMGVVGTRLSRTVLETYPNPTSFGICFLICFFFQVISWIGLSLNREPRKVPGRPPLPAREYWRRLPRILSANPNYTRYLVGRTLAILGAMGTAFYIVYGRRTFQVSDGFAANLTMAALISQTIFTPLLGWLGDRRGHKLVLELATAIGALGVLLILVSPSEAWLYGVFMLVNAATAGIGVASFGIIMEFSDPDDLPTFAAVANTILAVPILASPVLGGWLADVAGYRALFGVALACACLAFVVLRWAVREPRHERNAVGLADI
ncbi:MAG: MFS transporter, partial [Chloroflexota bacterium]